LCLIIFTYLVLRAIFVPILHDEAITYFFYVNSGNYIPFVNWGSHADVNNHLLNSFLMFFTNKWFGNDLIVLRLPNILSAILLFIYVWKLATLFSTRWIRW